MQLASRFASRSPSMRSDYPLTDDQIHRVAPSIFADAPHEVVPMACHNSSERMQVRAASPGHHRRPGFGLP